MPPDRFRQYVKLLEQVGARRIDRGHDPLDVGILVWSAGFAADVRHVAIVCLNHEPKNTVGSLDEFYKTAKPRTPVFRRITGNWYLWADW